METQTATVEKPYDTKEAADYLGISTQTLYGWISSGKIKPHRPSKRSVRFYPSELEAFVKSDGGSKK